LKKLLGEIMPRLAVPYPHGLVGLPTKSLAGVPGDDYKDRLVKYIPAESVALYTFTDKLVTAYYGINELGVPTKVPADMLFSTIPWVLIILGVIGTPIYLYRSRLPGQVWVMHAIISTIAFVLWAYTLHGSVFLIHQWYNPLLAGLMAPIFTFVAGWFDPR
jgi:hypothetical protein